jgi:hypothetical protein
MRGEEGRRLTKSLGYGEATTFRLFYKGEFFNSKPVVGIAHQFFDGHALTSDQVTGGTSKSTTAATVLQDLGFLVDNGTLWDLRHLEVNKSNVRPAPYQYVLVLWAVSRVLNGLPRMVGFNEVRKELADLLKPFALANTPPDPATPWIALRGSLWELHTGDASEPVSESDVRRLDLLAGLSTFFYQTIVHANPREEYVSAVVDVVTERIGSEPAYPALLDRLGFSGVGSLRLSDESPDVADAVAAIDEVIEPRRQFGRRFTAAENKAIELRAVEETCRHLNGMGYRTEDVGATRSYDIHATRGDEVIKVEVKGTTTGGEAVVLTTNEVALHLKEHPNTALAIVRGIKLDRSGDEPTASGGELELARPWELDESRLEPIAYRYRVQG